VRGFWTQGGEGVGVGEEIFSTLAGGEKKEVGVFLIGGGEGGAASFLTGGVVIVLTGEGCGLGDLLTVGVGGGSSLISVIEAVLSGAGPREVVRLFVGEGGGGEGDESCESGQWRI